MAQTTQSTVPQRHYADQIEYATLAKMQADYATPFTTADFGTNLYLKQEGVISMPALELLGADDQIGDGAEWAKAPFENRRDLRVNWRTT